MVGSFPYYMVYENTVSKVILAFIYMLYTMYFSESHLGIHCIVILLKIGLFLLLIRNNSVLRVMFTFTFVYKRMCLKFSPGRDPQESLKTVSSYENHRSILMDDFTFQLTSVIKVVKMCFLIY